jgi:hypothetical protein
MHVNASSIEKPLVQTGKVIEFYSLARIPAFKAAFKKPISNTYGGIGR